MSDHRRTDWDPRDKSIQTDPIGAYDGMRAHCPVAWSDYMQWSLFRHADVLRVIEDHETFSNAVSQHVSVPNGMDPPEHTPYRRMIEPYFSPDKVRAFAPQCEVIARERVDAMGSGRVEVMDQLGLPYAVAIQCAFMGWPSAYHEKLIRWNQRNQAATRAGDRAEMKGIAADFQAMVSEMIEARKRRNAGPDADVTASLMHEVVNGQRLDPEQITSIVRNWTVGELGTISAAVEILVHALACDTALQKRLRSEPSIRANAIEEILRHHGPLVANRRVATRDVTLGGRDIKRGERVHVLWVSANRDPAQFDHPNRIDVDRPQDGNLLYGAGVHVCPGAGLARMELHVILDALLDRSEWIALDEGKRPKQATFPASGYEQLSIILS